MRDTSLQPRGAKSTASPRVARKHNQRRELILRAAAVVFADVGYHGASLEDIAERLDLTRASLYHYFPSKDALLSTCLEFGAEKAIGRLEATLTERADRTPTERLHALIVTQIETICREDPELSRLFLSPMDWPDAIRGQVKHLRERHDKCFRSVIDEGVASGEFTVPNPAIARHCLHGAINYTPVWLRATDSKLEAQANLVADSLVLLAHPKEPRKRRTTASAATDA